MILAAPPAAAMTYVKPSSGLEPSVYGGGGSPSSRSLLDLPSLVSRGSAALVSATTVDAAACPSVSSNGNGGAGPAGAVAVSPAAAHAVVSGYGSSGDGSGKYCAGKPCEEKGGGLSAAWAEEGSRLRSCSWWSCAESRCRCESTSSLKRGTRPRREGVVWIESSSEATALSSGGRGGLGATARGGGRGRSTTSSAGRGGGSHANVQCDAAECLRRRQSRSQLHRAWASSIAVAVLGRVH